MALAAKYLPSLVRQRTQQLIAVTSVGGAAVSTIGGTTFMLRQVADPIKQQLAKFNSQPIPTEPIERLLDTLGNY